MSLAALLAAGAGASAVGATWEILASVERTKAAAVATRLVAPLRRPGTAPTPAEQRRLARTAVAVLLAAGWLLLGPLVGIALALAGPWMVGWVLRARRARWRAAAAEQSAPVARALA